MMYLVALISLVLASRDCTEVKDEEFVPHCGKCMYDRQCIGWNSFKEAANAIGKASFVYCCPNMKRCLQANPEDPEDYEYELRSCPSGAGWPEGDNREPAGCRDYMTNTVQQDNWRGNRATAGCSERSLDYPAGCQCANSDWPNDWASGCDGADEEDNETTTVDETSAEESAEPEKVDESAEKEEPKKVDESAEKEEPKKVDESAEQEEMTCDTCASTFVTKGGCPLWKSGAGKEQLMAVIPPGCDPEECNEQMWEECQKCDQCAVGFSDNGGCAAAASPDATLEKINALLPSGCIGEYCMTSIGDYCMNLHMCEECVPQFVSNGGCAVAMRGDDPTSYFPKECNANACATQAQAACMAEMEEEGSSAGDEEMCPEMECECKEYQNEVTTIGDDGCESCTCIPRCRCTGKCSSGKLPTCKVSKNSRCPDKRAVGKGRRKKFKSAVACMTMEEQAEWNGMTVAFEDLESEEWTVEDFAVYSFAAVGVAAIAYAGFSTIAGGKKYAPVENYETGEL